MLIFNSKDYYFNYKSYKKISQYAPKPLLTPSIVQASYNKNESFSSPVNFKELISINADCIGWIVVPNTNINYPIVKGEDNNFYLNHNFEKSSNGGGAIFMDYRLEPGFSNFNNIIYGHNMKNGSMFSHLKKYTDKDFFNTNKLFYLYTLDGTYEVEVVSAYVTKADSMTYNLDFDSSDKIKYINYIKSESLIYSDTAISAESNLLTLSTCAYEFEDARTVVHGVIVSKP
jgi:sortase B